MRSLTAAFIAECMKLRRSGIVWITIALFIFIPLMLGLLMFVAKNPAVAAKLGLIGTKASLMRFGKADWLSYCILITQAMAAIGMIGFGFVTSWVFGREYTEHTVKDILALPVARHYIVISKFFVTIIWCLLLSFIFLVFTLIAGILINLSGWSHHLALASAGLFMVTCLLTLLLNTPVAFFASISRGYLLPLGFVILTLIMANFTGLVGLGPYFPWAIPGIYASATGPDSVHLIPVSYIILVITSIFGFLGTIIWWRYADQ
jgi:ABC-2 type transport system permease protein